MFSSVSRLGSASIKKWFMVLVSLNSKIVPRRSGSGLVTLQPSTHLLLPFLEAGPNSTRPYRRMAPSPFLTPPPTPPAFAIRVSGFAIRVSIISVPSRVHRRRREHQLFLLFNINITSSQSPTPPSLILHEPLSCAYAQTIPICPELVRTVWVLL